ncbi:hypothetical protein COLO4_18817 [Corchorus olitorius]|uniref:RNA helicase n=1 Tax=Corchorus olitorius TaxID=93759 RepID=A0A1R3J7V1_9ROSI|nr:hypothetical protein COLO4_18817 [Corchorus olitorius]
MEDSEKKRHRHREKNDRDRDRNRDREWERERRRSVREKSSRDRERERERRREKSSDSERERHRKRRRRERDDDYKERDRKSNREESPVTVRKKSGYDETEKTENKTREEDEQRKLKRKKEELERENRHVEVEAAKVVVLPEVEKLSNSACVPNPPPRLRVLPGEDSDSDYGDFENDQENIEDDEEFMKRVKKPKAEKLSIVDHSKIDYKPFRKNFYIQVKEIARMTPEQVAAYRKELELKLHGKDVPKPVKTWHQTGLTSNILETLIKKLNYEKPMPIQAQALPIIMSGRDCIGIAKTGSGKTLAFVLPMLRHIKDQPPVVSGDGPIGLIMAPTRELVQQIHSDIRKFAKVLGIRCVPVYGGSGVAQQISELKRGTEIVVCTPGRMIDVLCTSGGKITNLHRVTYLVLDEADRMFDMGFQPQITCILQNIRPDRQTVLFSATFPRQVEILARQVLNKPVEIQVGGRSVVNKDITQLVEIRPESERLPRLLELLGGEWYKKGKILIFVQSQEKCDALLKDLFERGHRPCLSLHGAKDQTDRESTISDFKSNACRLLIATSIAARGLDVKELELVINFDVPNHYEDYVHRVGRTGRAGRKGCAITFISEDDTRYAPDLVKALELSEQVVPDDLKALADGFMAKVNQGLEQAHGTGYGGSGFKFNEEEDEKRKAAKKAQAKEYGFEEDKSDSEDEDEDKSDSEDEDEDKQIAAMAAATKSSTVLMQNPLSNEEAARKAALQATLARIRADAMPEHYEAELEINEFPQNARRKVIHKETLGQISERTGAAITARGQFFPPGRIPGPGERKLYLFIEGPTEISVKGAKAELKLILEDFSHQASQLPGGNQPGRYQVL